MHEHEHDHTGNGSLRPKAARLDEPDALAVRAALSGRLDAMGPRGMLGLQRAVGNAGATAALEEERSPVHDVVGSPGRPWTATSARTWRGGWATTSPTSACTPTARPTRRRRR